MKVSISLISLLALVQCAIGQAPWDNGKLTVSQNHRYLQHENGKPFFWLGDTGWLLFQRLNREEVKQYFENRKEKGSTGFNNAAWRDVNMFTSGHRNYDQDNTTKKYGEDNWRYVTVHVPLPFIFMATAGPAGIRPIPMNVSIPAGDICHPGNLTR